MIDGNHDDRDRTRMRLTISAGNPFPMHVPGIERSALKRPVTKEQAVDIATRIAYGMCQQLFEVVNVKHQATVEAMNMAHSTAVEQMAVALRAEMARLRAGIP